MVQLPYTMFSDNLLQERNVYRDLDDSRVPDEPEHYVSDTVLIAGHKNSTVGYNATA